MRASSLPLLLKCPGSLILPCDDTKSKNAQDGADWGTMAHHWAQHGEVKGRDARSENAFRKAIQLSGADRMALWPAGGLHEQAIAIQVDGGGGVSRDDSEREGWITGHYDYQAWMLDGELWIDDLKTGKYYPNPMPGLPGWDETLEVGDNRFPQDVRSPQLKAYALGVSELLGYTGITNISVTHWPRLPVARRHAPPERFWTVYTHQDLMLFWTELERLYEDSKQNERALRHGVGQMILTPGEHCRFCPARANCLVSEEFDP